MIKTALIMLITILLSAGVFAQAIKVSDDIEIIKISNCAYVHVSYADVPGYGRVGSNGVIFVDKGTAILFDTPMTEALTKQLMDWITNTLNVKVTQFAPNHWHSDCIGGLKYLHKLGIKSYANELTIKYALENKLAAPQNRFKDSLTLFQGSKKIFCYFPGAAHSKDNIVVWIPSEKILFAGCMVKELSSATLGNTADGDLKAYPVTIKKVMEKFSDAGIVIPGHGKFGGRELLNHTLDMALKAKHTKSD